MLRARTFALRFKSQNIKNRYTMKKIIKAISLIAFSAALAACSDNGAGTRETEVNVNDMAGTYAGYTLASCSYFQDMLAEDQTITVTAGTDGTVSLGYVSDTWGEFSFSGCTVTRTGSEYSVSGTGTTKMGMGGSTSSYDASVSATIAADKTSAGFIFTVPSVMGGLTIEFTQGEVPSALAVAGTYSGSFALSVGGSSQGTETLNCTITYKTDSTVDIALDEFTAMGTMKFSLSAEDVAVAEAADGYSLSGEIDTVSGETKVTGSVSGTVGSDGTAEITFVFTPGAMPMSITGVFTSPAPDEGSGDSAEEGGNE